MKLTILCILAFIIFSCKKEPVAPSSNTNDTSNYNPNPNPSPTTPTVDFIQAFINSNSWEAILDQNACVEISDNNKILDNTNNLIKLNFKAGFIQDTTSNNLNSTLNGIFEISFSGYEYSITEYYNSNYHFYESFPLGLNPYFSENSPSIKGAEIIYIDLLGNVWSSKYGSQANSSFNITSSTSSISINGIPIQTVKGEFTSTLYLESNHNISKEVTNGKFGLTYYKP
ncbi:MAG: hypothetical protein HYR91_05600 [Flavobacteriia bacterium]|nr:hypothetical protein [Flavobacteriia bacterium]